MAIEDYQDLVTSLVRDPDGLISDTERDKAIALAVTRYSEDRPRALLEDLTTPAEGLLDLPDAFDPERSRIIKLESPPEQAPPTYLDPESWMIYEGLDGKKIMFISRPQTGQTIRARFTAPHTLDDEADTIPAQDMEAVASWAAAVLCEQLASQFSGDSIPTIDADSVDHQSKGRDFANRASRLRKHYYDSIGVDPKRNVAAGAVVDLDINDSRGKDFIFKRSSRR